MEGCFPVPATSADIQQPTTTTTPLALAVATAEATSTAIASTSSDMSLTSALESSCTFSDSTSALAADGDGGAVASPEAAYLHRPSPSAPLVAASVSEAPSFCGGCTDPSSLAAGAGGEAPMTSIDESPSSYPSAPTSPNTNSKTTTNKNKKKRKVVRIDIYSDTTCPWCYITKKRLEKAIQAFQLASSSNSSSDSASIDSISAASVVHEGCTSNLQPPLSSAQSSSDPSSATTPVNSHPRPPPLHQQQKEQQDIHFDIHWRPFLLDPNAPRTPIRKTKLYHRKFGTERALQIQDRVVAAGKAEGVVFSYTDQSLYSNTIDSHRLLRFARERLGRLPVGVREVERRRKMVDSGNALSGSNHAHHQDQDQEGYFPIYAHSTTHDDTQDEGENYSSFDNNDDEEEEEVDEIGARMEDAMVDELFRSHFERGECSEFETLKSCARSVLIQTAAFSAAAALSLSPTSLLPSTATSAEPNTNTNESTHEEHYIRLRKAKEEELIDQQIQELDDYLHSDEGLDEVMEEIRVAKEDLGMQGVPMIVIQNEYLLSGAQSSATFVQVLQRVI